MAQAVLSPAGKIFIRECGFFIASVVKNLNQTPGLGALLDYGAGAFERFLQDQQRKDAATQLLQQQKAMKISVQEAESIAIELVKEDFPDISLDKKQAIIDLIKITPKTIYQRHQQLSKLNSQQLTQVTTVSPQATLPQVAEVYLPLLPKRRPKFQAGDFVEKVDLRGNVTTAYELKEFLASGGFGDVWRAKNEAIPVAVKFCLEETNMTALKAEAKNLQLLQSHFPNHPYIAGLLDFNISREPYWLAFEYVGGGTLEQRLYQGALGEAEALEIFKKIVKTLAEVHRQGLYHRDIKPANIMLSAYGEPKIADFGISWLAKPFDLAKTVGTTTVYQQALLAAGTPGFMSPEQQQGQAAQADDDVYALGVLLYQMLTGHLQALTNDWDEELAERGLANYQPLIKGCLGKRGRRFGTAEQLLAKLPQANLVTAPPMTMPPLTPPSPAQSQAAQANDDFTWQQCETKAQRLLNTQQFDQAQQAVNAYLTDPTLRHKRHEDEAHALALTIKQTKQTYTEDQAWQDLQTKLKQLTDKEDFAESLQQLGYYQQHPDTPPRYQAPSHQTALSIKQQQAEWEAQKRLQEQQAEAKRKEAKDHHAMGDKYRLGQGVAQDYNEAVKWYRLSAEQGNAAGQNNLGWMYANGLGVAQDYTEAVKWYRLSAEQGHASGQKNLGRMYQYGQGVAQDFKEAVKWYRLSAEQGEEFAQYKLGIMYQYGRGAEKNRTEAIKWYRLAAQQGNTDAQNRLKAWGERW